MQTNLPEQTDELNTKFHPLKKPGDWSAQAFIHQQSGANEYDQFTKSID
ncbi:hypothetical protein RMB13_20755 [Acinetobacter sp. V102_4]|nr:hypothetical protein [Acinetobacter sp. V102_4]MDS7931870.1 hypothetical protein [Acinetobacter sp. V102_4]